MSNNGITTFDCHGTSVLVEKAFTWRIESVEGCWSASRQACKRNFDLFCLSCMPPSFVVVV